MTITIMPFTKELTHVEPAERTEPPITYWGIYLDDRHVSYTSSRELAEKTKLWMEKWLKQN
jgi:hypothetical protein